MLSVTRVPARVANYSRAVDFVIDRIVHVAVNPQRYPGSIHKLLQIAGERGGQQIF